jgi:hypothetical protein
MKGGINMRNYPRPIVASLAALFLSSVLALSQLTSCTPSNVLTPRWLANPEVEPGTYSVIFYRDLAIGHLTTVAFLDREGDAYTIEPQSAGFTYSIRKGLPAEEALQLAEQFVRTRPSYSNTEIKAIMDPAGMLAGYEVRPIYQPFVYGDNGDVLDISYYLRPENKIMVWIRLKNRVEKPGFHDRRR